MKQQIVLSCSNINIYIYISRRTGFKRVLMFDGKVKSEILTFAFRHV